MQPDGQAAVTIKDLGTADRAPAAAWYALFVLTLVSFLALVDRQVLLLLAEPIRLQLELSDLQVGLLQGTGIALFTALASYPLGWLADRHDRRRVLAGCVLAWSAAVFACGLAGSFGQLFIASALVGAGEAGLAPIAYSLLPLLFAGRQRQLANSLFAVTAIGGGALAMAVCGQLITFADTLRPDLPPVLRELESWRLSFFLAALPAPLMVLLILSLRLPARPGGAPLATAPLQAQAPDPLRVPFATYLVRHRATLATFYSGAALGGFAFGAVIVWLAVIAARVYAEPPAAIGASLGLGQLVSAGTGFAASVGVVHVFGARVGARLPLRVMWLAMLGSAPACLSLLVIESARGLYVVYAVYGAFLTLGTMMYPTALQSLTPAHLRGRAVSVQFITTMLGAAAAPPTVGLVSDLIRGHPEGPLLAVVIVAVPAILLGAFLLRWCERRGFDATAGDAARIDGTR